MQKCCGNLCCIGLGHANGSGAGGAHWLCREAAWVLGSIKFFPTGSPDIVGLLGSHLVETQQRLQNRMPFSLVVIPVEVVVAHWWCFCFAAAERQNFVKSDCDWTQQTAPQCMQNAGHQTFREFLLTIFLIALRSDMHLTRKATIGLCSLRNCSDVNPNHMSLCCQCFAGMRACIKKSDAHAKDRSDSLRKPALDQDTAAMP